MRLVPVVAFWLAACGPQGGVKLVKDTGPEDTAASDCESPPRWYADADADGFGSASVSTVSCEAPVGYLADNTDCDDASANVSPNGLEVCNGLDDDCDDLVDAADDSLDLTTLVTAYTDQDDDGYGDPATGTEVCVLGRDQVTDATDCNDALTATNPGATETCNEVDDNCDGNLDEGVTTPSYADDDDDGYGNAADLVDACETPAGYVPDATDCDDAAADVNPAAAEVCNGVDDDCEGTVDEGATDAATWFADDDGDSFGDAVATVSACDAPAGYLADDTDCDDADGSAFPGAPEPCGGVDLDCDGAAPEACASCADALADGYGADGLYDIDPDGAAGALASAQVWCDQTTDGGGWTLVQRTVWDWAETSLLLTGYTDWYATSLGAATPGEVFRLAGTHWSTVGGGGQLLAKHVDRDSASLGDCDPLYYTGSGGTLSITPTTASFASLSSAPALTNADELSTTDSGASTSCVNEYDAVPWFYSACCTTCPSFQADYWSDEAHPMASYTDSDPDLYGRLAADVCPSGLAFPNESGGGYEGINVMELYLR